MKKTDIIKALKKHLDKGDIEYIEIETRLVNGKGAEKEVSSVVLCVRYNDKGWTKYEETEIFKKEEKVEFKNTEY